MSKFWDGFFLILDCVLTVAWKAVIFFWIICWLWHIDAVAQSGPQEIDAQFVLNMTGVLFPPLGAVMGFPF